jgi:RNA polymerase-interacting CarD/CdnL/TRCF family regulator
MTVKNEMVGKLLYHPVHGLFLVSGTTTHQDQAGQDVLCYSLVPRISGPMKTRFIIPFSDIERSGFHEIISVKEANKLLKYLKAGNSATIQKNQTWNLAQNLLTCVEDKSKVKDQRKRQLLEHSVKGLVGELSFVFNMTLRDTADVIQKNLASSSTINPLVLTALANAGDD